MQEDEQPSRKYQLELIVLASHKLCVELTVLPFVAEEVNIIDQY